MFKPSPLPPLRAVSPGEWGGVVGLLALLFLWTLAPLAGYDFWFYLAVGQEILETGEIPWAQTYLGTTSQLGFGKYADVAWLANLLCYAAYAAAGFLGLVLLKSGLLTLTTGLVYLSCRWVGLSPFWAGAWSALGLWTVRGRFEMRTYLFTDLCLAALVALLILAEREGKPRRTGVCLLLLFACWSNLHQGILAGFVVMGCWLLLGRRPARERWALFGTALAASLLRPNALAFPSFIYDHFANSQAIEGVIEWGAPGRDMLLTQLGPMYAVLAVVAMLAGRRAGRLDGLPPWSFALTALLFAALAARSVRSVTELLPVVCPLSAAYFPPLPEARRVQGVVLLAVGSLFLATYRPPEMASLAKATGYPDGLLQALPREGQVFNSFEFGNFLVFRQVPPFLHGMTGLYREQLIEEFKDVLNPTSERAAILQRYGVSSALLHLPEPTGDATLNLVDTLAEAPDWKLELWDDTGLLFLRGPREQGLTQVRPWRSPPWHDPSAAEEELSVLVARRPSAMAHRMLSELLLQRGEAEEAVRQATLAIEQAPNFYPSWVQLGLCYARAGNLEGVLRASAGGLQAAPDQAPAHFNRGLALLQRATTETGLAAHWSRWRAWYHARRALWLDPRFAPATRLLEQV